MSVYANYDHLSNFYIYKLPYLHLIYKFLIRHFTSYTLNTSFPFNFLLIIIMVFFGITYLLLLLRYLLTVHVIRWFETQICSSFSFTYYIIYQALIFIIILTPFNPSCHTYVRLFFLSKFVLQNINKQVCVRIYIVEYVRRY